MHTHYVYILISCLFVTDEMEEHASDHSSTPASSPSANDTVRENRTVSPAKIYNTYASFYAVNFDEWVVKPMLNSQVYLKAGRRKKSPPISFS